MKISLFPYNFRCFLHCFCKPISNLTVVDISDKFNSELDVVSKQIYQVGNIVHFSMIFNLYIIGAQTVDLGVFNITPLITSDINFVNIAPTYFQDVVLKNGTTLQLRTLKNIESEMAFSGSFIVG